MKVKEIDQILNLRREGYSFVFIANQFGKDHTTIIYHCQKAGLAKIRGKRKLAMIDLIKSHQQVEETTFCIEEEVINSGKNYADYLEEEKNRKWKNRKDMAHFPA